MTPLTKHLYRIAGSVTLALTFSISSVQAHEFIVKPSYASDNQNQEISVKVLSAHVFMVSEEIEPMGQIETYMVSAAGRTDIPLTKNEADKTLDGSASLADEGTHILCGHRKGMIWTNTTKGWKQASKKGLSGVISIGKYEKFSKAIITNGKTDDAFSKPMGHQLEIVPLEDPQNTKSGNEIRFQILYEGQPLTTEIYATYDGFSTHTNTYAYYSNSNEDGEVAVKITHPGTWMVRAQHELDEATADFDKQVLRAVLVFNINE